MEKSAWDHIFWVELLKGQVGILHVVWYIICLIFVRHIIYGGRVMLLELFDFKDYNRYYLRTFFWFAAFMTRISFNMWIIIEAMLLVIQELISKYQIDKLYQWAIREMNKQNYEEEVDELVRQHRLQDRLATENEEEEQRRPRHRYPTRHAMQSTS